MTVTDTIIDGIVQYDKLREYMCENGVSLYTHIIDNKTNSQKTMSSTHDFFLKWMRQSWVIDSDCMIWFPVTKNSCAAFIVENTNKYLQAMCYHISNVYSIYANDDGLIPIKMTGI